MSGDAKHGATWAEAFACAPGGAGECSATFPWHDMLTDVQRELWEAYEKVEGRAPRAEKLRALEAFLETLALSPGREWFPWARSIAERVVDQGANLVIRRPLFEQAIFPALLAGYRERLPGCARWLAGLSDNLHRCPACREQLALQGATEVALLRAATRHDPTDRQSVLRLIDKFSDRLRYAVHEVPAGVLYGFDGASPEQCEELERELDEFCRLVDEEGLEYRYSELIRKCRRHFRAYRNYLLDHERYDSYADYLSQHAVTSENAGSSAP